MVIRREDRTKWIIGGVLSVLALALLYNAFFSGEQPATQAVSRPVSAPAPPPNSPFAAFESAPVSRPRAQGANRTRRNMPVPAGAPIDPKLRLDLLAKTESVSYEGSGRSIFQYYTPPPPPPPRPVTNPVVGPDAAKANTPPAAPPAPPIPLKYYGYAHKPMDTVKKAFLVEGEEIFIVSEGDIVNKRYKILKIGVNTIEVEDQQTKNKQTLPLQDNP